LGEKKKEKKKKKKKKKYRKNDSILMHLIYKIILLKICFNISIIINFQLFLYIKTIYNLNI